MPLSQVPDRKVKRQKLHFGFQESSHCIRNGCRAVDIQKMACQIQGLKCSGTAAALRLEELDRIP